MQFGAPRHAAYFRFQMSCCRVDELRGCGGRILIFALHYSLLYHLCTVHHDTILSNMFSMSVIGALYPRPHARAKAFSIPAWRVDGDGAPYDTHAFAVRRPLPLALSLATIPISSVICPVSSATSACPRPLRPAAAGAAPASLRALARPASASSHAAPPWPPPRSGAQHVDST